MGVNARKTGCTPHGRSLDEFSICKGRWDRNRTCNLRFWSTRRTIQSRPTASTSALNPRLEATHRPGSSKHVQPVCSQFCSQADLHPSAGRRSAHEPGRPDSHGHPKQSAILISSGCHFREQVNPTPSPEGIRTTVQLSKAGEVLDVELLGHIVLGLLCFVNLKERGLGV